MTTSVSEKPAIRTRKQVKPSQHSAPAATDFSCSGLHGTYHDYLRLLVRYAPIGEIYLIQLSLALDRMEEESLVPEKGS